MLVDERPLTDVEDIWRDEMAGGSGVRRVLMPNLP
jgi:hypothetical protein